MDKKIFTLKFVGGPYDGSVIQKDVAPAIFVFGTNVKYARHTYIKEAGCNYRYHGPATTRTIQMLDKKYGEKKS